MPKWLALAACWLGLVASLWAAGARYGMTRAEVEAALGAPAAELTRGPRLILRYPRNGTVELEHGVVVKLTGVPVDDGTPPPPTTTLPPNLNYTLEDLPNLEMRPGTAAPRASTQELMAATERLEASRDQQLVSLVPGPLVYWSTLLVGLVIRALVTIVVLKFAFRWCDVHADWIQMVIPALADTGTQAAINGAAYALWHTNRLFNVDTGIAYFVLIGVLLKTTHACTLQRAVAVATAAKFASFVTWILISAALLNLMAGSLGR